jgi:hypothetical protein
VALADLVPKLIIAFIMAELRYARRAPDLHAMRKAHGDWK